MLGTLVHGGMSEGNTMTTSGARGTLAMTVCGAHGTLAMTVRGAHGTLAMTAREACGTLRDSGDGGRVAKAVALAVALALAPHSRRRTLRCPDDDDRACLFGRAGFGALVGMRDPLAPAAS